MFIDGSDAERPRQQNAPAGVDDVDDHGVEAAAAGRLRDGGGDAFPRVAQRRRRSRSLGVAPWKWPPALTAGPSACGGQTAQACGVDWSLRATTKTKQGRLTLALVRRRSETLRRSSSSLRSRRAAKRSNSTASRCEAGIGRRVRRRRRAACAAPGPAPAATSTSDDQEQRGDAIPSCHRACRVAMRAHG